MLLGGLCAGVRCSPGRREKFRPAVYGQAEGNNIEGEQ